MGSNNGIATTPGGTYPQVFIVALTLFTNKLVTIVVADRVGFLLCALIGGDYHIRELKLVRAEIAYVVVV